MNAIIRLSWKNIMRRKRRSILLMAIIAVGVFAGTFVVAFINGWMQSGIDEHLRMQTSHLQIHAKGYNDTNDIGSYMEKGEVEKVVSNCNGIAKVSYRLKVNALLTTAETGVGVVLIGVDADDEKEVSDIHRTIDKGEGDFLADGTTHPIVISRNTAEALNAHLNSKILVTLQDTNGNMQEIMLRVGGIFHTYSKRFDSSTAYILRDDMLPYMSLPQSAVHEAAIRLKDFESCKATQDSLAAASRDFDVKRWDEIYPLMEVLSAWREISNVILLIIFFSALAFGIMNFMLMSVMERKSELNMLRHIGVSQRRMTYMILAETLSLISIGTVAGSLLCLSATAYFSKHGIDISFLLDNVRYGFSPIIYPKMVVSNLVEIVILVFVTGTFSSITPVKKATLTYKSSNNE